MAGWNQSNPTNVIGTSTALTTLTNAYNSTVRGSFPTGNQEQVVLYVKYTSSTAANSIQLKVERSPDNTNWFPQTAMKTEAGVGTLTNLEPTFVRTAATSYFIVDLPVADKYIRVSAKETLTGAAGTVWVSTITSAGV